MSKKRKDFTLDDEDIHRFHDDGFLGPFELCQPCEIEKILAVIDRDIFAPLERDERSPASQAGQSRHLDQRSVYDLCSHPRMVDRVTSLLGPDLIVWRSQLFDKLPGSAEVPWHQDLTGHPIEPPVTVSAWLALTEATRKNACLEIIPGSHKKVYSRVKAPPGQVFESMADPSAFDAGERVCFELRPGQFYLFSAALLHHSAVNTSGRRRLGLAVRYAPSWVKVYHEILPPGHGVVLVHGRNHSAINRVLDPPGVRSQEPSERFLIEM